MRIEQTVAMEKVELFLFQQIDGAASTAHVRWRMQSKSCLHSSEMAERASTTCDRVNRLGVCQNSRKRRGAVNVLTSFHHSGQCLQHEALRFLHADEIHVRLNAQLTLGGPTLSAPLGTPARVLHTATREV